MFSKLALKNVTKSMKDYAVYFLTLMFGVCLFYMFNSLDSQAAMLQISQSQQETLKSLSGIIGYVSVFVSVILGFLVVYANGFLMKRRKKELGVYMTLGMPKGKISFIMILETFLIGLFSLTAGLVAGIFLSQGMSVVTAKLFEANLSKFVFTFSSGAFWKTLVYFGVMFLVVMAFNMMSVSRLKLIDLLSAGHKNEKLRIRRLWISVILFLLSVGCLATSYYLIETNGIFRITNEFIASLLLGIIGTLLFFLSLSGFLLRVVKSNRKLYFKGLNMFVLRQFNSKINTTFVSVSVICIMLLITIGTLSTGLSVSQVLSKDLRTACPYDVTMMGYPGHQEAESGSTVTVVSPDDEKNIDILASLKKAGIDISQYSDSYAQVKIYEDKTVPYGHFLTKDNWPQIMGEYSEENASSSRMYLIPLSDYNALMKMQGKPSLALASDQYAVNCTYENLISAYQRAVQNGTAITIDGKNLKPLKTVLSIGYFDSSSGSDIGTLILPDSFFGTKKSAVTYLNLNYRPGTDAETADSSLKSASINSDVFPFACSFVSRKATYERANGSKTIASYLALYIGLVFLIAAAAVLALQQLSESSDNAERYGLLRKLGAEGKMVNRALFTQVGLYFLLPLSLAIIHSVVGINTVNRALVTVRKMDILGNITMTASIFVIVYGAYFLATYLGSKSMIRQKKIYRRRE